jgi:hypothetical protein
MEETFDKVSPGQLRQLSRLIEDAKDLSSLQVEIIEKVIKGETDLHKLKLGYLKEYFDVFSEKLDQVARKCSQLTDGFLILNSNLADSLKVADSLGKKAVNENYTTDPSKSSGKTNNAGQSTPLKNTSSSGASSAGGGSDNNPPDSSANNSDDANKKDRKVGARISDDVLAQLDAPKLDSVKNFADQLAEFFKKTEEERRNAVLKNAGEIKEIRDKLHEQETEALKELADKRKSLEDTLRELEIARYEQASTSELQLTELRLTRAHEVAQAELAAQNLINDINNQLTYSQNNPEEAGELKSREDLAKTKLKEAKALEAAIAKDRANLELYYKRKNNGILDKEDAAKIEKALAKKYKIESGNEEKLEKRREKHRARLATIELEKANKDTINELRSGVGELTGAGKSIAERKEALYQLTHDETGNFNTGKALSAALVAVSDLAKQLESQIDEIAGHKGAVDTRLQGSSNKRSAGSYWDQIVKDMTSIGAINPFFKQTTFADNIKSLIDQGIAFDLEQRAFLKTIQEKIATTFNVADGTLLRLIRLQQEDSTAGRLGMESALNAFLNSMYENTEYLKGVAEGVRTSLEEMQSLMQGAEAAEVEYQVQKWLGSLYSVGMSQTAVSGISTALGQVAAGQIDGLTGGGAGNLLVMAANKADLSIADILTDGLDSSDTNKLLQAVVRYLAEIADSSKDNNVVQQQLAEVFGVKASDLRAATNLVSKNSLDSIYGSTMTYSNMLNRLMTMAGSMHERTSIAEMMTNIWENGKYTLAGSMASNPVSYFIYKMATVVDDATGGIALPFLNIGGFGVDLNTTVADLMRVAAVGGGLLGSLGPIISGLGSSFSGRSMLQKLGINAGNGLTVTPRGDGGGIGASGANGGGSSTSGSGYVGNASGSDVKDSTIQESKDSKKQQMIEAKEEESENQVDVLNTTVLKIYELLDDVANGNGHINVRVEGYGLTKARTSQSIGGVGALDGNAGGVSTSVSGGNSGSLSGLGGSVDLGGWTLL